MEAYTLLFLFAFLLYFVPALIANSRKAKNNNYICLLNLLTGWTIIGWIAAFIWAVIDKTTWEATQLQAMRAQQFQLQPPGWTQQPPPVQVQQPPPTSAVPVEKPPVRIRYVHHGR